MVTGGGVTMPVLGCGRSPAIILPKKCVGVEKEDSPVSKSLDGVREDRRRARRTAGRELRRGDERAASAAAAASSRRWRGGNAKKKKETIPVPYLWGGFRNGFHFFPPTISTIVGGICFVPRDTWRYPEHSIRPHRGLHGPNGSFPDRMRLPGAGTQAAPCVRRGTRVRLCTDGMSSGPRFVVSDSSGI